MNTLKRNILFKGILTFSNYIIGFVTFPYITRILGPSNFGLVNFAQNTVDYFLLFAAMGINTIGTREIAAVKDDPVKRSHVYSSILGTNVFFTIITLAIFFILIGIIPRFHEHRELFYIGSAKIVFSLFIVEWLFTGTENFRYITIRSLIIRLIYVISVFLFIKSPEDYLLYFILTTGVVVINSIINFVYSRKFVSLIWKSFKKGQFIKSNIRLGIYSIMTSMYITFNVMYLGLVSSDTEVGYYSTAVKLYFVAVSLFSAFTAVMMPRMSALRANNEKEQVQKYIIKSFRLIFLIASPIIIISEFFSTDIIVLLSGYGYDPSVLPMRIIMPALFLVWISQVLAFQTLIPLRKDNILLISSLIGGGLAILLNILITPRLQATGTAITLLSCEFAVTGFYMWYTVKKRIINFPDYSEWLKAVLFALPYIIICFVSQLVFEGWFAFSSALVFSALYFYFLKPKKLINK